MRLESRIKRLEAMSGEDKVSWRLMDGTPVKASPAEA